MKIAESRFELSYLKAERNGRLVRPETEHREILRK